MNKNTIISIIIVVVAIGAILFFANRSDQKPGKYDQFAVCLEEQGSMFYGAFWCQGCQSQKALFGRKSVELVPYTECSTPDGQGQTEVCIEAGIESYPTWEFSDGERETGVVTLETLAEKTSCELPS